MNKIINFFRRNIENIASNLISNLAWIILASAFAIIFGFFKNDPLRLLERAGNIIGFFFYFLMALGLLFLIKGIWNLRILFSKKPKSNVSQNTETINLSIFPRMEHPGLWEDYYAWLEIVGGGADISDCFAVLRKLEFEKDGMKTNCLEKVANSKAPKMKLSNSTIGKGTSERLDFVRTDGITNLILILAGDINKPLPVSNQYHNQFYFEVVLNGTRERKNDVEIVLKGYIMHNAFASPDSDVLYIELSSS